jgi:hypothetical protein
VTVSRRWCLSSFASTRVLSQVEPEPPAAAECRGGHRAPSASPEQSEGRCSWRLLFGRLGTTPGAGDAVACRPADRDVHSGHFWGRAEAALLHPLGRDSNRAEHSRSQQGPAASNLGWIATEPARSPLAPVATVAQAEASRPEPRPTRHPGLDHDKRPLGSTAASHSPRFLTTPRGNSDRCLKPTARIPRPARQNPPRDSATTRLPATRARVAADGLDRRLSMVKARPSFVLPSFVRPGFVLPGFVMWNRCASAGPSGL